MLDIFQQVLHFLGHGFCHQFAERSFEAGGLQFCVCARCTGLYLGFIITLIVLLVAARSPLHKSMPAALPPQWAIIPGILLMLPLLFDGVSSYAGLRETTNLIRYLTGYACGMGLGVLASAAVLSLWPHLNHRLSAVNKPVKLIGVLAASAVIGTLFYVAAPYTGVAAPLLVALCLWLTVALVVLLIVSTTRLWRGAQTAARRIGLIALSLLAALVVLALLSLLASALGLLFPWFVHP
ncbi:MAG: DUF2085 domain-containing protein [Coriobacteriales bacterium]|jgi:uncharacterized membrane protein|nr:DUF2085 domain-containing protein [Coriobacteriales bacterium]